MNHIDLKNKTIFVTGSAGFIGSNLVLELLRTQSPINIIGLDNMNDYYDVNIKEWRLQEIKKCVSEHSDSTYVFYKDDLADKTVIDKIFAEHKPDIVVNLGAQAGVRYSITNPDAYIQSNMIGFYNILEACRHSYDNGCKGIDHLVYASSSSVYGTNKKVPYSTEDKVDNPVSLYAATKKSNELMAHAYSKLYNIPSTGLRFFTVYGPAGRPDMAYFGFTNKLIKGDTIQIFNYGNCKRDFTYIDDIVEGVKRVMQGARRRKTAKTDCQFRHTPSTTSETAIPKIFWTLSLSCRKNYCAQKYFLQTMISNPTSSSLPCSQAMCRLPSPTPALWNAITASNRTPAFVRA